jgi:hypothetical protein
VTLDHAIERIQFCYPHVYYACHTRHARARSDASHLSLHDSAILVHLDRMTNPEGSSRRSDGCVRRTVGVLAKVVFSPYATIDTYQSGLRKRLISCSELWPRRPTVQLRLIHHG